MYFWNGDERRMEQKRTDVARLLVVEKLIVFGPLASEFCGGLLLPRLIIRKTYSIESMKKDLKEGLISLWSG